MRFDLGTVEPSLAGPRRPEDRVPLRKARESFAAAFGVAPETSSPNRIDIGLAMGTW
jgi:aconitate hydratase A / 2-methylisocitrate dehydratase